MKIQEEIIIKRFIEYDNKRFYEDKVGYWICKEGKKFYRLHRYLYEKEIGKIPQAHHIHHIDFDRSNNDILNLKLMPIKEHLSLHSNTEDAKSKSRESIKVARKYAKAWHRSEDGMEWHKEHYKNSLGKLHEKKTEKECMLCGEKYMVSLTNVKKSKFCSSNCKSTYRKQSGIDNEIRNCNNCSKEFKTNKYSKIITCSRKCGQAYRKK